MGELYYCPSCGNETKECECNLLIEEDEIIEAKFRWEYQHEGCSYYGTKFKKNYADRDE
jgi:hypothetical protein